MTLAQARCMSGTSDPITREKGQTSRVGFAGQHYKQALIKPPLLYQDIWLQRGGDTRPPA